MEYHPRLQDLELVQCDITDDQLAQLKRGLDLCAGLVRVNLASNKLTPKSAKPLHELLQSAKNKKLMELVLDNNFLLDITVEELAVGLMEKYQRMCEERNSTLLCPLDILSLRHVCMTDKGLSALVRIFDEIASKNKTGNEDYENMLALDISENDVANNGLTMLAQLLARFNAVSSLGLSSLSYAPPWFEPRN